MRIYSRFSFILNRSGQSLVEVLVAIVVGTILVVAALSIIAPVVKTGGDVGRTQAATALSKELLDSVKVFAQADWHNISNLATSSANRYFMNMSASPFRAATGTEGVIIGAPTSSPLAYWKMDESGTSTISDFSGNGQSGTISGGATATSTCPAGGCLNFNGSSGYVDMGTSVSDSMESAGAVSAWVYRRGITGGIFARSTGSGWADERLVVFFRNDSNGWGWSFANGTSYQNPQWASSTFPTNQWVHFALTWNGSSANTYLNGVLFDSRTQTITPEITGVKTRIGWTEGLAGQYFDGKLDDVRVYNRALSAQEVADLYKASAFSRYFYVDDVKRAVDGSISDTGAVDPSTKKVTVNTTWLNGVGGNVYTYLTRSRNNVLVQGDWSGGGGTEGPLMSISNRFATSSNINYSSTTGFISIGTLGGLILGTIDSTYRYAWSESIGWIDFYGTGTVFVEDGQLRGYADSVNAGYFALDCSTTPGGDICSTVDFKVTNDGNGNLAGWAWNDIAGWVSFSCDNTSSCGTIDYRVTINSSGDFHGWAWSDSHGWVSFNCAELGICGTSNYKVKTTWVP